VPTDDVDDSRIVEGVYIPSEITSVVEDTLVDSSTLILDEVNVSSEDTSDIVDALVEPSTPKSVDIYVHEDVTSLSMY